MSEGSSVLWNYRQPPHAFLQISTHANSAVPSRTVTRSISQTASCSSMSSLMNVHMLCQKSECINSWSPCRLVWSWNGAFAVLVKLHTWLDVTGCSTRWGLECASICWKSRSKFRCRNGKLGFCLPQANHSKACLQKRIKLVSKWCIRRL